MRRWEDNINTGETGYEDGDSIGLGQDTVATLCEHGIDTVPYMQEISHRWASLLRYNKYLCCYSRISGLWAQISSETFWTRDTGSWQGTYSHKKTTIHTYKTRIFETRAPSVLLE
jgi:hypothetical protein